MLFRVRIHRHHNSIILKVQLLIVKDPVVTVIIVIPPPDVPAVQDVKVRSLSVSDAEEEMFKHNAPASSSEGQEVNERLERVSE